MRTDEMRLDGNAVAGTLREVFVHEMTVAIATCGRCRWQGRLGEILEYGHAMGVVLRCPQCDGLMLRMVTTPGWIRLDLSGIALLQIPD
jgi:hypothetical protein